LKYRNRKNKAMSDAKVNKIIDTLLDEGDEETYAIVAIMLGTGARISEVLAMDEEDIGRLMIVRKKKAEKEKTRTRSFWIAKVGRIVWFNRCIDDGVKVCFRLHRKTVWKRCKALGFEPHQCRHTYATNLLKSGVPLGEIMEALGHDDMRSTIVYCGRYMNARQMREALEMIISGVKPEKM